MYEMDRFGVITELERKREKMGLTKELLPEDTEYNLLLLDSIIYSKYNCNHENAITDSDDLKGKCNCLDCGDYVNPNGYNYQMLYTIKKSEKLSDVRKKYLELLLTKSTDDAIKELTGDQTIKLRRQIVRM